ncbi:MAG: sugar ABC transporter ATP-binding protein [Verrucomicrobiales bacterium]|nr:sugar ABC transporter ATP-binding protein [Verrucomicrobiales bacterium]
MSTVLLRLGGVSKSFGAVRALRDVSFQLHSGEVHALLGENGAGKTTLIKIVTGAHPPDAGTVEIAGQAVRHLTPARAHRLGVACIYQQPALFPDLTVAENIALRLEPLHPLRRVRWTSRRQRATALLLRLGAAIPPDAPVGALSMPEQQLVEIACALGAGARILIMDEPTAALSPREVARLFEIIRTVRANGAGVIYITHRLEEVFQIADRVTVLRDGECVGTRCVLRDAAAPAISKEGPLSESALIAMMVGREMTQLYPTRRGCAGETVLCLRNLSCSAGGLRNVNLEVRAGEVLGLAGLVGAGRTELARALFGLTPADAGEIVFCGRRVVIRSPRDAMQLGIACVPEDRRRHGVIPEMTLTHNLTLAIQRANAPDLARRLFPGGWLRPRRERAWASEEIRKFDVRASGPDAPVAALSGGNQQKVALARWLVTQPKLLILDEPTQGVDVGAKSEIHQIIRRLADGGMAVLLISSDLPEILGMSDRIAVMRRGTVVAEFTARAAPHEVLAAALGLGPSPLRSESP